MIDTMLKNEIRGLDKLFEHIPEGYTFHDAELEDVVWNMAKNELVVTYSCHFYLDGHVYFVTFHIIPEMNDFELHVSPHNPFTYGIDITRSNSSLSKYSFEADGSGPIVNCEDLWIEIKEGDPKEYFKED